MVYTRRLGVVSGTSPSAWLQIFRAAPGFVTVLRSLVITNPTTGAVATLAVRVRPLAKAGEWWLYYKEAFPVGSVNIDLRQVIEPNEACEVFSTTTGVYVAATGYVFSEG